MQKDDAWYIYSTSVNTGSPYHKLGLGGLGGRDLSNGLLLVDDWEMIGTTLATSFIVDWKYSGEFLDRRLDGAHMHPPDQDIHAC